MMPRAQSTMTATVVNRRSSMTLKKNIEENRLQNSLESDDDGIMNERTEKAVREETKWWKQQTEKE